MDADPHRPAVYLSPAAAAAHVIGSGLIERLAADMTRLEREIAAKPVDPRKAEFRKCFFDAVRVMGWRAPA